MHCSGAFWWCALHGRRDEWRQGGDCWSQKLIFIFVQYSLAEVEKWPFSWSVLSVVAIEDSIVLNDRGRVGLRTLSLSMGIMSRRVLPACGSLCVCCPELRARSRQPVKRYKRLISDIFPKSQVTFAFFCAHSSSHGFYYRAIEYFLFGRGDLSSCSWRPSFVGFV